MELEVRGVDLGTLTGIDEIQGHRWSRETFDVTGTVVTGS
jgi:hypothetical protein